MKACETAYEPIDPLGQPCCCICLETDAPLVTAACRCRGTVGVVHAACVDRWRSQFDLEDPRHVRCMQCGEAYPVAVRGGATAPTPRVLHPGTALVCMICASYVVWLAGKLLKDLTCWLPACHVGWMAVMSLVLQAAGAMCDGGFQPVPGRWAVRATVAAITALTLITNTDDASDWAAVVDGVAVCLALRIN
jgi:E3 ubiquitin-protein ligase DOA10